MIKVRDNSVDIAKGIGIILVVWAHTKMSYLIFSFHMPLFFILSGFFVKNEPTKSFLYKKFRTLFVPLCVFYVFSLLTKIPFQYIFKSSEDVIAKISDGRMFHLTAVDVTLWYIVCLIEILCLYHIIEKYISRFILKTFCIIMIFACGWYMVEQSFCLPFYITHACICLPLLYLGKMYNSRLSWFCEEKLFFVSTPIFILSYIFFTPTTNILNLQFQSLWTFLIPAISGSFMILGLSQILAKSHSNIIIKTLSSIGIMSLFIMALSEDVRFVSPLCRWAKHFPYGDVVLETSIVVAITYFVGKYINEKFPYLWRAVPIQTK